MRAWGIKASASFLIRFQVIRSFWLRLPINSRALKTFRHHVTNLWQRSLQPLPRFDELHVSRSVREPPKLARQEQLLERAVGRYRLPIRGSRSGEQRGSGVIRGNQSNRELLAPVYGRV
jgi:hypothetical protein